MHPNTKDITGQQFGLWTVVKHSPKVSKTRHVYWECVCVCGATHVLSGASLRVGSSAGCRRCKSDKQEKSAHTGQFYTMRRGAERRGYEWAITLEYFVKLIEDQNYLCKLTGLPIVFGASRRDYQHGGATASLDRIDSGVGYVVGNLQWVHKDVNRMKMDLPQDRLIELCKLIANNN